MDLADAYQQIVTVPCAPAFLRRLIQILEKERRVKQAEENRHQDNWNLSDLHTFGVLKLDAEIIDGGRSLYSTFEDYVINKLPQPPVISADDLQEIALAQLGGMTDETKELQLQRFTYHVLLRLKHFEGCNIEIDLGHWTRAGMLGDDDYYGGEPLWEPKKAIPLANGFELNVEIEGDPQIGPIHATALIEGICTTEAAQRLTNQIGPAIKSLVRQLKLAATDAELETARESPKELTKRAVANMMDESYEQSADLQYDIGSLYLRKEPFNRVLEHGLAYLFINSTFAQRIKNALELTSHADEMANEAVALSLGVSAFEALLCSNKDKKKQALQSRIPALLGADQKLAEDSANAIGILYKIRSRCFHGEDVLTPHELAAARKLVAAALRATLTWAVRESDSPDQTENSMWITELKAPSGTLDTVAGVNKELAQHLRAFTVAFGKDRLKGLFDESDDE